MPVTQRRKLLKAAVGVATVSYVVACGQATDGGDVTSGNLVAAPGIEFSDRGTGGRSGLSTDNTAGYFNYYGTGNATSGNLVAPPPLPPTPVDVPSEDAGAEDAAVPPGNEPADAAADAAPAAPDAVDSGP